MNIKCQLGRQSGKHCIYCPVTYQGKKGFRPYRHLRKGNYSLILMGLVLYYTNVTFHA
jgi:hypothetical protein